MLLAGKACQKNIYRNSRPAGRNDRGIIRPARILSDQSRIKHKGELDNEKTDQNNGSHFPDAGMILGGGCGTPEMTKNSGFVQKAYELGKAV